MGKKILVLGAGFVARPLVHYLLEKPDFEVVCASLIVSRAEELVAGFKNGSAKALDVNDEASLESLIIESDLVVSLVPYTFHVQIARICIRLKKQMVTTSYVSDAMKGLDAEAKAAGIVILNEVGLDPGIDHMSAMRVIHHVEKSGGKVVSFKSCCGGLPAPEANNNPMGYKFSWSPRGVLMAGRNSAKFKREGEIMDIPGSELFNNHWEIEVPDVGVLEVYPNRNSLPYAGFYGLEAARTMFRGTFRYPGWCSFWYRMAHLGWLDETVRSDLEGKTWADVMRTMVKGSGDLKTDLCSLWSVDKDSDEIKKVEWLGLLSDQLVPAGQNNLLDLLCSHLTEKLAYRPGERDMVVLHHDFEAHFPDRKEQITSTLVDCGIPNGDSSMSRTVSLPAAIAARHILQGRFGKMTGVKIPVDPEVYIPILEELESFGIKCVERFSTIV